MSRDATATTSMVLVRSTTSEAGKELRSFVPVPFDRVSPYNIRICISIQPVVD